MESGYAFCVIIGGGQVGSLIAQQLLDLGWPANLIELMVSDASRLRVQALSARGLRCCPFMDAYKERLPRATVIILAIRPSNLENFARMAAKYIPPNSLLVSCLAAVPIEKILACVNADSVIRTTLAPTRLPLSSSNLATMRQAIHAALSHAIVETNDANNVLAMLRDLFRKRCMCKMALPANVASGPEFVQIIVANVFDNLEDLLCNLLPRLEHLDQANTI